MNTCLILGLVSLINTLITTSLYLCKNQIVPKRGNLSSKKTKSTFSNPGSSKELGRFFVYALERFSDCSSRRKSHRALCCFNSECNTSLTNQKTESGCTIQAKMIHLPKTQNCTQNRFPVFKVPARSESWNNSNRRCCSAFPLQYFITRLTNVRNQTGQALVNCSRPFCDCTAKFVHEPKNIRSTNSRHMWTLRLVNSKILFVSAWSSATLTHCDLQVSESFPQTSRHL